MRNEFSGTALYVVQAGQISGGVHFHVAPGATPLERGAGELGSLVYAQWRDEASLRGLAGSASLAVPWGADWPTADHHETVDAEALEGGGLRDLAAAFRGLACRRLVVLGPPGSGKSSLAVLLALELLRERGRNEPVPVVVLLTTWDPASEHFDAWLARRITEDYAGRAPGLDRHTVARLVRDRRVLPVLDGLDELPAARRGAALAGINVALAHGEPVVLTSRADEYADATGSRHVLDSAAVVRARPVSAQAGIAYLRAAVHPRRFPQWQPVLEDMVQRPAGPVTSALSSPLMLWLMTSVYADPATRPADITDTHRFPDQASVEGHLLDGLVPAVFRYGPASPDQVRPVRRWNAERALRWLRYLAVYLNRSHTRDFAWWQMRVIQLHPVIWMAVLLLPISLLGLVTGDLFAAVFSDPDAPFYEESTPSRLRDTIQTGSAGSLAVGLTGGAVAMALQRRDGQPRRPASPRRFASAAILLVLSASTAVTLGSVTAIVLALLLPLLMALVLTRPVESGAPAGPSALLRGERNVALIHGLVIAPAIAGIIASLTWSHGPATVTGVFLAGGLSVAAALTLINRWGRWTAIRVTLSLRGRIPWSVMSFLQDAHRLGVLRQVGGVYQFRHARLQQRLSGMEDRRNPPVVTLPPQLRIVSRKNPDWKIWLFCLTPCLFLGLLLFVIWPLGARGSYWDNLGLYREVWDGADVVDLLFIVAPLFVAWTTYLIDRHRQGRTELRLTDDGIELRGRRPLFLVPWESVAEVSVRTNPVIVGLALYCIALRLTPGHEPPPKAAVMEHGWIPVWDLGASAEVPRDIDIGLSRFAGTRWNPLP
ncbi:NACHT domain-containing protein [Streptomyces niveus]|uniref:NACHT domain-containing protein n=1 Tax=Streptomyces niveus TaxID=193462 RepID=UPI003661F995